MTRLAAIALLACAMSAVHNDPIELKNAPVTVTMKLAGVRHPKRHLMLRMEGIAVQGEVGAWEVRVGNRVAGTLSTFGAEAQPGKYVAEVPIDGAVAGTLHVTFAPTTRASGTIRVQRVRVVEE
jgi:hypothetical protein